MHPQTKLAKVDHPDLFAAVSRLPLAWIERNKAEVKSQAQQLLSIDSNRHKHYNMRRRRSDPAFKLLSNLRGRLRAALKGQCRSKRTIELLGCTIPVLKAHLESGFKPGMTWDNYGSHWEIDHIRPCSSFDLMDHTQQKECFQKENLQPLWTTDNRRKSAKWAP